MERLLGTGARLGGVDDELLIGVGVGGERIPVQCDLIDDRMVVGPRAPPFHRNVCSGPPLAELLVSDREVADEFGEARVVGLAWLDLLRRPAPRPRGRRVRARELVQVGALVVVEAQDARERARA